MGNHLAALALDVAAAAGKVDHPGQHVRLVQTHVATERRAKRAVGSVGTGLHGHVGLGEVATGAEHRPVASKGHRVGEAVAEVRTQLGVPALAVGSPAVDGIESSALGRRRRP